MDGGRLRATAGVWDEIGAVCLLFYGSTEIER